MGNTRHNVSIYGWTFLGTAFVAGVAAAVGVSMDPSSWRVTEPFFGLPEECPVAPSPCRPPHVTDSATVAPSPRAAIVRTAEAPPLAAVVTPAPAFHAPAEPTLTVIPREPSSRTQAAASRTPAEPAVVRTPPPALLPTPSRLVRIEAIEWDGFVPRREPVAPSPQVFVAVATDGGDQPAGDAGVTDAPLLQAAPAAPLPGAAWGDPDGINWVDEGAPPPRAARTPSTGRVIERLAERRADDRGASHATPASPRAPTVIGDRLRSRLRGEGRLARSLAPRPADNDEASASDGWPTPVQLLDDLETLANARGADDRGAIAGWAHDTLDAVHAALDTEGPGDPHAGDPLLSLSERVATGMAVADKGVSPAVVSQTRRAALAVSRRVAVWRAAAAWCAEHEDDMAAQEAGVTLPGPTLGAHEESLRLLECLERYEIQATAADAAIVRAALASIAQSKTPTAVALVNAVADHYHAANVRVAVHRDFVSRMLPDSTVTSGPVQDFVLGRPVRGRSTVEQSVAVRFVPHPSEIRMELVVNGEVASRTVTSSGPVEIHSRGQASFTVYKPITVTSSGLAFGDARGNALSRAQLASIETSFDRVPIMNEIVRSIARKQHDEARQEANREVSSKVLGRACRQIDQEAEPKLGDMAEHIRETIWQPLVTLGLEPSPVALETTDDIASVRLRLAAPTQLAAHTPRPRAPANALVSFQMHETVANNAVGQFGFEGKRLELPQLARLVCERLGIDPRVPNDLPDDVVVTFARKEPLRVECRDGLVHVRVSLEAFEYGRRHWYDIVAKVAYRPVVTGAQVYLEREGAVQIGGPGHEGRLEIGLRTVFGKIFAKEREIPLVPATVTENPKLAGLRAVQAVATDGWLAIALADPKAKASETNVTTEPAASSPTAANPAPSSGSDRRFLRR